MLRLLGSLLLLVPLVGCAIRAPDDSVAEPTPVPTSTPTPAASISDAPPTASPTPLVTPPPTPDPRVLELEAIGCDGGVVLDWSSSEDPAFHHYVALRSPQFEIDTAWPPIAPAVDWGDTYATDRFVTSAVDASIIPSATIWYYRVMAYDAAGTVVGASPVRSARLAPVDTLAAPTVEATEDGRIRISWGRYLGRSACFSSYRVLQGSGAATTLIGTVSERDAVELVTSALAPGATTTLRVEAVRTTALGSFVVGRTEAVSVTIP